jgi:hypothetical protein
MFGIITNMIYVLQEQEPPYRLKIGYSANVQTRVATLAAILPQPVKLVKVMEGELEDEQWLHSHLQGYRVEGTREWYYPTADVLEYLDDGSLETELICGLA